MEWRRAIIRLLVPHAEPPDFTLPPHCQRHPPLINGARRQSPEAEIKYFCLNVTFVSFAAVERDICQNRRESPASETPPPSAPSPPPPPLPPPRLDFLWERGGELLPASTRVPLRLLIPRLFFLPLDRHHQNEASPRQRLTTG